MLIELSLQAQVVLMQLRARREALRHQHQRTLRILPDPRIPPLNIRRRRQSLDDTKLTRKTYGCPSVQDRVAPVFGHVSEVRTATSKDNRRKVSK
jgi:hypothetical protein